MSEEVNCRPAERERAGQLTRWKKPHVGSCKTFRQFNWLSVNAVSCATIVNLICNVERPSLLCHWKSERLRDTPEDEIY